MDVQIEALERRGRALWQVGLGRRRVIFHEELAARTFAAQLHLRLRWLQEQAELEPSDGGRQPV